MDTSPPVTRTLPHLQMDDCTMCAPTVASKYKLSQWVVPVASLVLGACADAGVAGPSADGIFSAAASRVTPSPTHEVRISFDEAGRLAMVRTVRIRRPLGAMVAARSDRESGTRLQSAPAPLPAQLSEKLELPQQRGQIVVKYYRASRRTGSVPPRDGEIRGREIGVAGNTISGMTLSTRVLGTPRSTLTPRATSQQCRTRQSTRWSPRQAWPKPR